MNPGGSEKKIQKTIAASLQELPNKVDNSYLHENWGRTGCCYEDGGHPLQRNAQLLFKALGTDVADVCASNLIFLRSVGEGGAGYPANAHICWPVHEMILGIVNPEVIITFGNRPFDFVCDKLGITNIETRKNIGHGNWVCRVAKGDRLVIGFPHLSRYSLHGKEELIDWLKTKMV